MLFVSGVFPERIQRYKIMMTNLLKAVPESTVATIDELGDTSVTNSSDSVTPVLMEPTPAQRAAGGDTEMQQQMIETFCKQSGMKREWSAKCLIDQDWDYEVPSDIVLQSVILL
ncbi:unnamed protein product [Gongylonema pulchrum]|uniref:TAP-C domain-containing protein n=1 Tax=Gongylonema pulchrum TaxID=637853 RepID=A0A183DIF1_9BILA|nr:unnamed protein product [Gongylonema pulchrum]